MQNISSYLSALVEFSENVHMIPYANETRHMWLTSNNGDMIGGKIIDHVIIRKTYCKPIEKEPLISFCYSQPV